MKGARRYRRNHVQIGHIALKSKYYEGAPDPIQWTVVGS
jgi:hypothetical protein